MESVDQESISHEMGMHTQSLRGRDIKVYLMGERVAEPVDHPMIRPSVNAMARTKIAMTVMRQPNSLRS